MVLHVEVDDDVQGGRAVMGGVHSDKGTDRENDLRTSIVYGNGGMSGRSVERTEAEFGATHDLKATHCKE